jgi:hypothetical protein
MAFDIVLCFITPDAGRVTGFLTAEPLDESLEKVTFARDKLQGNVMNLTNLTIFTRDESPMLSGKNPSAMEITLPSGVIEKSVLITQIIEVAA